MQKSHWIVVLAVGALAMSCSSNSTDPELLTCSDSCSHGLVCVSSVCLRPVLPEGSCMSSDAHCIASNCVDGVCVSDGTTPELNCSETVPCDSKYACSEGQCVPKVGPGERCAAGVAACRRGTCENGRCVISVGPGQACSTTSVCPEVYECRRGVCLQPILAGGSCRSSLVFCKDGACREGVCYANNEDNRDVLMSIDTDGDTIVDYYDRCDVDTDGDTVPNCRDLDSDGDTIPDSMENYAPFGEEPTDSDGDGVYDFLSLDSDSNGMPDAIEGKRQKGVDENGQPIYKFIDTDGDTILDSSSIDNDGDGISDAEEIAGIIHTSYLLYTEPPVAADCNGDTIPDERGTVDSPFDCDGDTIPDYLSFDSDGDTIGDIYEGRRDSDGDGFLDRYSQDSDGDGVPDREEKGTDSNPLTPPYTAPGNVFPDYQLYDTDGDSLSDGLEVDCGDPFDHSKYKIDTDGDGDDDATEYAAAIYAGGDPKEFICNPNRRVKEVFDFYFSLPYGGDEQSDALLFKPSISKLDVVFNVDTTESMGDEIANLKNNIKTKLVPDIRARVADTAFGVTRFDDFPTRGTPGSKWDYNLGAPVQKTGYGFNGDMPYERLSMPIAASDDKAIETINAAVDMLKLNRGGDMSEAGYEALYQIAKGDDKLKAQVSWRAYENYTEFATGKIDNVTAQTGRWGGVEWREKSLPVVLHITDATAHDKEYEPYDPSWVENAHYSDEVHAAYASKGIRVVSVYTKHDKHLDQLKETSKQTRAYVPVCAFQTDAENWRCGANKCCTVNDGDGKDVATAPQSHQGKDVCILSYAVGSAKHLSSSLVDGIDAIVKYSTFSVTTAVRGVSIAGTANDTSCFIKRIEALDEGGYMAPPKEPERSCNPVATAVKYNGSSYANAYENFAVGTSSESREGAKLTFKVVVQNDACVKPTTKSQVFQAYIDIVDATSQVVLGTQVVSIIVPGVPASQVN